MTTLNNIKGHFYIALFLIATTGCFQSSLPSAESSAPAAIVAPEVLHPRYRKNPTPAGGKSASVNPPVFLIPPERNSQTKQYSFRLSQDRDFPLDKTREAIDIPFAIYNPHEKLAAGTWYWQYRYGQNDWSEMQVFDVPKGLKVFETPSISALIKAVPVDHPRMLVFPQNLAALQTRNRETADAKQVIALANAALSRKIPLESIGNPTRTGTTKTEKKRLALDASKALGNIVAAGMDPLAKAYVLTEKPEYAKAAIQWANAVASWDPNGVSMTNNFADSECMLQLAQVYDACFELLTPEEKTAIRASIQIRGNRFYENWAQTQSLEAKVFSAHVWQHIIERLFKTSLTTLHDIPEAEQWLTLIYEMWLARSPVLGPEDGGWWNGNHYFELNALTLLDIPMILQSLTGMDFLSDPFYANNAYWLMYSFPPNSYSDGFGNGTEKQVEQKMGVLGYADALSRLKGDPYAAWYADQHLQAMEKTLADDNEFRWFRIRWDLPDRPAAANVTDLPSGRVFRETGTVNLHTDLQNPANDLMVSMRSSPFGSTSHAHADQNGFNIQFGGQRLFYNSGYRPSMGVPHYTEWFKATKGHNTVLIDGKEQPIASAESYGWIPRFLQGNQISYALGDASKAYDNASENPQQAGMKTFRRHLTLLHPNIVVIYDELEADHPATWSWLLHSIDPSQLNEADMSLQCETTTARSQVHLMTSSPVDAAISTVFDPKPVNYRGLKNPDGSLMEYKDQWHFSANAETPVTTMRYLAIIQVQSLDGNTPFLNLKKITEDTWSVGEWTIQAGLKAGESPHLLIEHQNQTATLAYGMEKCSFSGVTHSAKGIQSTLLLESKAGKLRKQEAFDELPPGRD